jgi:hypothetical protein
MNAAERRLARSDAKQSASDRKWAEINSRINTSLGRVDESLERSREWLRERGYEA